MADYLKSPVFSSPSYWIALGVGVVGIGAAAMQERKGSAAKVYDTPFDPSTLSDKPGSASPRQIAILMSMGALLPDGKDVHGKTMRVSNRQAAGLIRSMGEMRRADKASSSVAYNVYLYGKLIDTVFQSGASTVEEVKRSLIDHDGYDPAIRVTNAARSMASSLIHSMGKMRRADKAGMRGSAARRLSSINAQDGHEDGGNITQQRVDADQAMFNHRFGGLVQNRKGLPRPITKRAAIDAAEANHTLWSLLEPGYAGGTYLRPGRIQTRIAYYQSKLPWTDADRDTRLEIAQSKTPYSSRLERKY
jgi:hypothetical protein